VRVWDIPPDRLCRNHLLGQHNEIHGLWTIITQDRKGFARHPETSRWRGKLAALYHRHEDTADEMLTRGYRHASPLPPGLATGEADQTTYVDTLAEQERILHEKGCGCQPRP